MRKIGLIKPLARVLPAAYDEALSYYEELCILISAISEIDDDVADLTTRLTEAEKTLQENGELLHTHTLQITQLMGNYQSLTAQLGELETELQSVKQTAENAFEYAMDLTPRVGNLETDNTTNKSNISALQTSVNEINSSISELNEKITSIETQISQINDSYTSLNNKVEAYKNEYNMNLYAAEEITSFPFTLPNCPMYDCVTIYSTSGTGTSGTLEIKFNETVVYNEVLPDSYQNPWVCTIYWKGFYCGSSSNLISCRIIFKRNGTDETITDYYFDSNFSVPSSNTKTLTITPSNTNSIAGYVYKRNSSG